MGMLSAGAQGALGLGQYFSARKQLNELGETPEYEIPQEARDQMSESQNRFIEGLPAESQRIASEQILARQAGGLQQLASRKAGLLGVSQADMTATQGMNQLVMQDVSLRQQQQEQKRQAIAQARGEMISQQETVYQEGLAGYTDEKNRLYGMQGAGIQNTYGGVQQYESAQEENAKMAMSLLGGGALGVPQ